MKKEISEAKISETEVPALIAYRVSAINMRLVPAPRARGASNLPKDGVYALEGVVETDWSVAAFTMNWKLTRPHHPVTFEVDEPVCMLVPQRRNELEAFEAKIRSIEGDPELYQRYAQWHQSRTQFLTDLRIPGSDAVAEGWEKHYFQGTAPDGA